MTNAPPQPAEHIVPRAAEARSIAELAPHAVDPRIAAFAVYWLRLRPEPGALPSRARIDPVDVPKLLPILYLVDVLHARRLRGTDLVRAVGEDYTGRFLDEAHPRFEGSRAETQFRAVAAGGSCWWLGPPTSTNPPDVLYVERLVLPLAADGRTVDMLIGATIFTHPWQMGAEDARRRA